MNRPLRRRSTPCSCCSTSSLGLGRLQGELHSQMLKLIYHAQRLSPWQVLLKSIRSVEGTFPPPNFSLSLTS